MRIERRPELRHTQTRTCVTLTRSPRPVYEHRAHLSAMHQPGRGAVATTSTCLITELGREVAAFVALALVVRIRSTIIIFRAGAAATVALNMNSAPTLLCIIRIRIAGAEPVALVGRFLNGFPSLTLQQVVPAPREGRVRVVTYCC